MKIYHTETQEDYDALMVELERQGCKWLTGDRPTKTTYWHLNREKTCVNVQSEGEMRITSKEYHSLFHPDTPITKYKAKADEKMRFTKENVYKLIIEYRKDGNYSLNDLQDEILNLDDTPEKVVVPKFVADWIKWNKGNEVSLQIMLKCYKGFYESTDARETEGEKAVQWYVDNPYKFIQAYEDGYTIEPEQLYYIPLPHLELPDGTKQVLSKRKGYKHYFANYPTESLQQRFTKAEIAQVPEIYKFYAKPIEEEEE